MITRGGRRSKTERELIQRVVTIGEWNLDKCECGEWVDRQTGEHLETVSLAELLADMPETPRCSLKDSPAEQKGEGK
jgi:hypothetical protein